MNLIPEVHITFKGQPLTQQYFAEHPEIHALYPSKEEFMNRYYLPLVKKQALTNTLQLLEISENSVRINGVEQRIL